MKEQKEEKFVDIKEARATKTAFILMFPAVIIAGLAAYYAPVGISLLSIALAVYQFLMLKSFVQDFYRGKY
jgi:hypothetical protein